MNFSVFNIVANALMYIGKKTGFSYNEVNIIIYFFLIPFSWFCLLDVILNFHFLKAGSLLFFTGFFSGCRDFKAYSDRLFGK